MAPIAVLALQGGFASHVAALRELGHRATEARTEMELDESDGLVLPGGESTVHLTLLDRFALAAPLARYLASGRPVLATCAGLILAARAIDGSAQRSFGAIDVTVARNAYGRQAQSFVATSDDGAHPLVFIRAPRIVSCGPGVEVVATHRGEAVLVRERNVVGATFHPELTDDRTIHRAAFGDAALRLAEDVEVPSEREPDVAVRGRGADDVAREVPRRGDRHVAVRPDRERHHRREREPIRDA